VIGRTSTGAGGLKAGHARGGGRRTPSSLDSIVIRKYYGDMSRKIRAIFPDRTDPSELRIPTSDLPTQLEDLMVHVLKCERWARFDDRLNLAMRNDGSRKSKN